MTSLSVSLSVERGLGPGPGCPYAMRSKVNTLNTFEQGVTVQLGPSLTSVNMSGVTVYVWSGLMHHR